MKITISSVGKVRKGPCSKLTTDYHGRLAHYRPLDLKAVKESSAADPAQRKLEEGQALRASIPSGAITIVMDERGEHWTSQQLADWLENKMTAGTRHLALLIGGPEGHAPALREEADLVLALSAFTLPHDLARVMLAEQLYRAFTIIRGEPYHR